MGILWDRASNQLLPPEPPFLQVASCSWSFLLCCYPPRMQRVGVALGAVTWARGLLQDPALAWDMTQYLQGQNCCHVLLLAGTSLSAAAQAASILCLASCRVWSWLLPSSKDSGSLSQSRQDCLQGTVSHRGLYAAVHKQRESSPLLSQAWPSRHTVLWAVNCQTVTEIASGETFWDCW